MQLQRRHEGEKVSKSYYTRENCRLCKSRNIEVVLPLAPSPLCDAYVHESALGEFQESYPLDLFLCRDCGYVFLPYVVDPEVIYRDYIYVTTSSLGLSDHFGSYAADVVSKVRPAANALVVDIGSNDGTLLRCFQSRRLRVLGIEPATEIARNATDSGVETLAEFFDIKLAETIVATRGSAAIITINNLFANIDDLDEITCGVRTLLAEDGVLVVESSYLADMIENMVFDFAYHEHLSYFSVKPLARFFASFGLELFDLEHVATKGGSLRYYVQKSGGGREVTAAVTELIARESRIGLDSPVIFAEFSRRIAARKNDLVATLKTLKDNGKIIAGYGASATTTTLIHHFDLGGYIDCFFDDNPAKQFTFSPGLHIPVFPSSQLYERRPDYVVVFAWRYSDAIIRQHQRYLDEGGRFICPLPELAIVEK